MKLQQLRYIVEICNSNLNISAAAESLYTSQPGISKQVRLLEDELGVQIFERSGKHLSQVTPVGQSIIRSATEILTKVDGIKSIVNDFRNPGSGVLNIYTTQTIARYILPSVISYFVEKYPKIALHMFQTAPQQISQAIPKGYSDFSIVAQSLSPDSDLVKLPCYLWNLSLVVPKDHALSKIDKPTLAQLAEYSIVTYDLGATGRETQDEAFNNAGLAPKISMTATDADVVKTYVGLGFGIGIISSLSAKDQTHQGLVVIDASHLFKPSSATIFFKKGIFLQSYMYDFIEQFAPHLTKAVVQEACFANNPAEIEKMFAEKDLPVY